MSEATETDEALSPVDIGVLGAPAEMLEAHTRLPARCTRTLELPVPTYRIDSIRQGTG